MANDFAILILSCDKYADLWSPFFRQFRKHFPVEGYPVYLGSNLISCEEEGVITVLSGPDADWSTSYKRILEQISEKKLFVILEDLLLTSPVDNVLFCSALDLLLGKDVLHIKYWAAPMPDAPTEYPNIGLHERGAPYRASVCGFWDREYLLALLIEGESPWNFEILGSYRTSYSDGFYGLIRPLCNFCNMVEKGSWIPQSVSWAREEGIDLELDKRPLLRGGNQFVSRVQMFYFYLMLQVPWRWRVALLNKLRRVLISY